MFIVQYLFFIFRFLLQKTVEKTLLCGNENVKERHNAS